MVPPPTNLAHRRGVGEHSHSNAASWLLPKISSAASHSSCMFWMFFISSMPCISDIKICG